MRKKVKRKITSTSESSWGDYPIKFLSQFDGRFHHWGLLLDSPLGVRVSE